MALDAAAWPGCRVVPRTGRYATGRSCRQRSQSANGRMPVPGLTACELSPAVCRCARRCSPRLPGALQRGGLAGAGHGVVVPGGAGVMCVLASRVDKVGPGLRAADLDRAPAESCVEASGVHVLLADAEVT